MKNSLFRSLIYLFSVIFFSIFTACESDSNGENGLVGRYWAQCEYQMEQLIDKVDNAEPFWELWDEHGKANYNCMGEMFYFVNSNTVHVINYVGLKSYPDEGWGYYDDLLFTLTYGDDTVYYWGNLTEPSICSYEILDGKLYIYSNSDIDQYNLVDGGFVLNGGSILYESMEIKDKIIKENPKTKITEGQKVDLGLSVKWAGWNIGADSPEEYGGFYGWGEVVQRQTYSEYYYGCDWGNLSKMDIGGTEYDVATVKWGDGWRIPSRDDLAELIKECEWSLIRYKGAYGAKVTGPNGNSIFLPFPGYKSGNRHIYEKESAMYWLSESDSIVSTVKYGQTLFMTMLGNSYHAEWYFCFTYFGCSVRAVCDY